MNIRHAVRAGSFYESSPSSCLRHATRLVESAELPADLPKKLYGGIVPHAGWAYSGNLAARTFKAIALSKPATLVVLGADHCGTVRAGEVFDSGVWRTPLGEVAIDEELAAAIIASSDIFRSNPDAHLYEHSIEVQLPLIQVACPSAKVVPIGVPPSKQAVEIGLAIGNVLRDKFPDVRVVGSSDLTHHGGHFPSPGGHGKVGVQWAARNDRKMIGLIESMSDDKVVPEAQEHANACGAGAIAAAIAACKAMGATRGLSLGYTNSYEVVHSMYPNEPDETTVGYISAVFA